MKQQKLGENKMMLLIVTWEMLFHSSTNAFHKALKVCGTLFDGPIYSTSVQLG